MSAQQEVSNTQAEAAQTACMHVNGGSPGTGQSASQGQSHTAAMLAFAPVPAAARVPALPGPDRPGPAGSADGHRRRDRPTSAGSADGRPDLHERDSRRADASRRRACGQWGLTRRALRSCSTSAKHKVLRHPDDSTKRWPRHRRRTHRQVGHRQSGVVGERGELLGLIDPLLVLERGRLYVSARSSSARTTSVLLGVR
jgi:hypothetical protein